MNKRERQILVLLMKQTQPCTAASIAGMVGCSVRSVKSYVSNLNDTYENLILSSRSGYLLRDRGRAAKLVESRSYERPQDAADRDVWLLSKLLIQSERLNVYTLADEMCVSYQTLMKVFSNVKHRLGIYSLNLRTKNDMCWISGNQKDKRDMLIDLIYEEMPYSFTNSKHLQQILPNSDIDRIREITSTTLMESSYYVDDYSLINVMLYITVVIAMKSRESGAQNHSLSALNKIFPVHILNILNTLQQKIYTSFRVSMDSQEMRDIGYLIVTRSPGERLSVEKKVDIDSLMARLHEKVTEDFGLKLSFNGEDTRFANHILNMLSRVNNGIRIKNPQLSIIRSCSPYVYEIAVAIAKEISSVTGFHISEDEIGFLAIYIAMMFDEQHSVETKIKAVLICPNYIDAHTTLYNKLQQTFSEELNIVAVISDPIFLQNQDNYDFVISTVPVIIPDSKTVKYVANQLTATDVMAVSEEIIHRRMLRIKAVFSEDLATLFKEQFYFYAPDLRNETEAIEFLSDRLYEQGYVEKSFKSYIFERERVCSSALLNVAIPHTIKNCSKKTAIAVAVLPNGIPWYEKNTVNLVLMLAICEKDKMLLQDIMEWVTEYIADGANLQQLIRAETYDQFMGLLESFFSKKIEK